MRSIVVRNSRIPALVSWFFPVAAITLWPFIFIKKGFDNERLINHESIHIRQYNEMLVLGFWLVYIYDWIHGLILFGNAKHAYQAIRFEQEAYDNDGNLDYLDDRPKNNWASYKVRNYTGW